MIWALRKRGCAKDIPRELLDRIVRSPDVDVPLTFMMHHNFEIGIVTNFHESDKYKDTLLYDMLLAQNDDGGESTHLKLYVNLVHERLVPVVILDLGLEHFVQSVSVVPNGHHFAVKDYILLDTNMFPKKDTVPLLESGVT